MISNNPGNDRRREVIRIRAETDQFLLSCVELSTSVNWLDGIFAAISVAAPIDERDFPRDQSNHGYRGYDGFGEATAAGGQ